MVDYRPIAKQYAQQQGIPWEWFEKMITIESNWNPNAHNASGADGIAQIVPSAHPGVNTRDPVASLAYAAQYVRQNYDRFGSWPLAFAAYNWGTGNLSQYGIAKAPAETVKYLTGILGAGWRTMIGLPTEPSPVDPVEVPEVDASWGSMIGAGIVSGAGAAIAQGSGKWLNWAGDTVALKAWNIGAVGLGTWLIAQGLLVAAAKSGPAKAATQTIAVSAPDPEMRAAARGIRMVQ